MWPKFEVMGAASSLGDESYSKFWNNGGLGHTTPIHPTCVGAHNHTPQAHLEGSLLLAALKGQLELLAGRGVLSNPEMCWSGGVQTKYPGSTNQIAEQYKGLCGLISTKGGRYKKLSVGVKAVKKGFLGKHCQQCFDPHNHHPTQKNPAEEAQVSQPPPPPEKKYLESNLWPHSRDHSAPHSLDHRRTSDHEWVQISHRVRGAR